MPLTFKESNLLVVTLISWKQNQCRIAEENNEIKFTYDNSRALRRFFAAFNQVAGE